MQFGFYGSWYLIAVAGHTVSQEVLPHLQLGQQVQGGGQEDLEEEARQGEEKACYKDAFEINQWFTDHVGGNLPIVGKEDEAISVDSYHKYGDGGKEEASGLNASSQLAQNLPA